MAFSAEQQHLQHQFQHLESLAPEKFQVMMQPFAALRLSRELEASDWIHHPRTFSEQLSAWLWLTHQIDAYRQAALEYERQMTESNRPPSPVAPRVVVVLVGKEAKPTREPLFRQLRGHGTTFDAVQSEGAMNALTSFVNQRAAQFPLPYGHWYIDGGEPIEGIDSSVSRLSYAELLPR